MNYILTPYILTTIIFLTTVAFLLYKLSIRNFDYWREKGVPYPKPLPLIGNFLDVIMLRTTFGEFLAKLYNEFQAPYFGIYILNNPYLVLRNPNLIKLILVKEFNNFHDHAMLCDEKCDPIAAKVLTFIHNPEWKQLRTKLTPVFSTAKIKNMFKLINEVCKEMNTYLDINMSKNSMDAKEVCAKFTTDVIATCGFGIKANSFEYEDAEFRKFGRQLFDCNWKTAICQTSYFIAPGLARFLRLPFLDRSTVDFFRRVFWTIIKEREGREHRINDLIDIINDIRKRNSPHDDIIFEGDFVAAQAIQFYAAGFETTSSIMSFTLYELCLHPDIQHKLRLEIKAFLSQHQEFTYEAIQEMKYLHKVLCESLRKYPVFPFLDRVCRNDYNIPGSTFVIEKGTPVYIPLFGLHYDPEYFPKPECFDPERFSDERKDKLPTGCYIPFGIGPRNCIGERFGLLVSKLGLARILSEYEVEKALDTPVPIIFDPKSLFPASTVGVPMKFKKLIPDTI